MTRVRQFLHCDDAELEARRLPRDDIVAERATDDDRWHAGEGPFRVYERTLQATRGRAGNWDVIETTSYRLAMPVWAWLFHYPVRNAIRRRRNAYGYWWAPPDRLDARSATVLGLLCTVAVIDGYLGTVLTQTLTFAADEFGHGNTAQGILLATVRLGVLIALVSVAAADRHGRRRLLIMTGVGSCIATALGAVSPTLWFLGGSQLLARGLSTALGVLIVIMAAEEMPARSRAWAASVLVLCAGLGSGMAVWVLPVADLDERGWRLVYLAPLAGIAVLGWVGKRLPESRRFEALDLWNRKAVAETGEAGETSETGETRLDSRPETTTDQARNTIHQDLGPLVVDLFERGAADQPRNITPQDSNIGDSLAQDSLARQRRQRRFILLAAAAFCVALFVAPASGLQNDFLKDERGFSAGEISLFTIITATPAGIGILIGGYLADRRGRKPVGAGGLAVGALFTAGAFFTSGSTLWLTTLAGVVLRAASVPALAVYGPELFGTHDRGKANGGIVAIAVAGSAVGLLSAGWLSDHWGGRLGPALALLVAGPLIVALIVLLKFPETAGQELEDLNPEDLDRF